MIAVSQQAPQALAPHGGLHALRAQVAGMQDRRLDAAVLPVHPVLAGLLPDGGLRPGSAYALGPSAALLLALLSGPSQAGEWCAVIGMPELGVEAGERAGIDLARLALVPDPGPRWLAVVAAVAEAMPVVAVRAPGRAQPADVARLSARLRDRGTALLVQGAWPQAEATLTVSDPVWAGIGQGHGCLSRREVTVTASSRRWPVPRRSRLVLPAGDGGAAAPGPDRVGDPELLRPVPRAAPAVAPGLRRAAG